VARVTLKDVAAQAGVSYQTVSKVLNQQAQVTPETAERIWRAVRELKYEPDLGARSLRTKASHLIGYPWHHTADNLFHPVLDKFVHSAANAAKSYGYHLLTFVVDEDVVRNVAPYAELYARKQVGGFILADTIQDDPRIAYLLAQEIPFVAFGRANDEWEFCWVDVDGRDGMRQVVDYLVEQGHRRIGLITWPEGSLTGQHRDEGYREGLAATGITPDPEWVIRGPNAAQTGVSGMRRLLALPERQRPTAVACVSDLIALGAIKTAVAAGLRVGGNIAITGFDDVPMGEYMLTPLTTVRQPIAEVGRAVIDLLLQQMHGEATAERGILLRPELVIRDSA
jgi:DNA-binding LacI/PurR family transcriptional regulator